jgi:GH24 family phage-related lysozyme (muramidase)
VPSITPDSVAPVNGLTVRFAHRAASAACSFEVEVKALRLPQKGDPDDYTETMPEGSYMQFVNCQPQTAAVKELSVDLSSQGLDFIKGWENLSLTPYNDSEGYCTVGWGKLIAMEKCENLKGNPDFELYRAGISSAEADSMLKKDIKRSEQYVKNSIDAPVYQQEYDALVSLIFNIGSAAGFKKCPKLLLKLNSKDYNGCCDEFADIANKGTNGLVKRRRAEMRIFRNNVYDSSH